MITAKILTQRNDITCADVFDDGWFVGRVALVLTAEIYATVWKTAGANAALKQWVEQDPDPEVHTFMGELVVGAVANAALEIWRQSNVPGSYLSWRATLC